MIRFALLFTVLGAVFSAMAFSRGGTLPGIVFAICAIVPLAAWITMMIRNKRAPGAPLPGATKGILSAVAVVLVAALAYSVYWTFAVPKASKRDLTNPQVFADACGKPPAYFPAAAPFTGAGPHPIVVFAKQDGSRHFRQVRVPYNASQGWRERDETAVQLIACLGDVSAGDKLTDCAFTKGSRPLHQGRFRGKVIEAHTGVVVGEREVLGSTAAECPRRAYSQAEKLHTTPEFADLRQAFGGFVAG